MEALIPKLFILTAEVSIVLLLLLIAIFIFNSKAKRRDIKAANTLVKDFIGNKDERIKALKSRLQTIGFSGNKDEQADLLYNLEKSIIKEFVTVYLRRDTYRLLDYSETLMDSDNKFLNTSGSPAVPVSAEPAAIEISKTEENANATILAREQAESNEAHLKELSELRLKNTELNEHLFEALETITALMTEHGKKTGQEVESNAQKILEAIIYLRDNRLNKDSDPTRFAPSPDDDHDKVDDPWSVDLAGNDGTLDDSSVVNLGISDELDTDLDTLEEEPPVLSTPAPAQNSAAVKDAVEIDEADPWADALAEQAATEGQTATADSSAEEADPWADALAEQAATEIKQSDNDMAEESDPWADALAEQAATESSGSSTAEEEEDPWAAALAEQEKAEKNK